MVADRLPRFFRQVRRTVTRFDPAPIYRKIVYGLTRAVYKPSYIGLQHIPSTGPAILICNHVSYMDGPIISAGVKALTGRHVRFIIEEDIYNVPGVNYIMKRDGGIPIAPNRRAIERAFNDISDGLRNGDLICIFPEGWLTFTGGLGRFKPGIEWMIERDPVPVVPMALNGLWGSVFSRRDLKKWHRWLPKRWLRGDITLIAGTPIAPENVTINSLQDTVLKLKYSISH